MPKYYVNKKGKHQVHKEGCSGLAGYYDRRVIGVYENGIQALMYALEIYSDAEGCKHCLPEINKTETKKVKFNDIFKIKLRGTL